MSGAALQLLRTIPSLLPEFHDFTPRSYSTLDAVIFPLRQNASADKLMSIVIRSSRDQGVCLLVRYSGQT
jgi:hypothetical protein